MEWRHYKIELPDVRNGVRKFHGEPVGILKLPYIDSFYTWTIYHPYDREGVMMFLITEAEFETWKAFDLFPVYGWFFRDTRMTIYDPNYFEVIKVKVREGGSRKHVRKREDRYLNFETFGENREERSI